MIKLSLDIMKKAWPAGDKKIPGLRQGIADKSEEVFAKYGIDTPMALAHFMAQLSHECGEGRDVIESLYYSAQRMTEVWPGRFPTIAAAAPYAKNERALGNKTYNGRMGNRPGTDDGYNLPCKQQVVKHTKS
jgi:putative chitinase